MSTYLTIPAPIKSRIVTSSLAVFSLVICYALFREGAALYVEYTSLIDKGPINEEKSAIAIYFQSLMANGLGMNEFIVNGYVAGAIGITLLHDLLYSANSDRTPLLDSLPVTETFVVLIASLTALLGPYFAETFVTELCQTSCQYNAVEKGVYIGMSLSTLSALLFAVACVSHHINKTGPEAFRLPYILLVGAVILLSVRPFAIMAAHILTEPSPKELAYPINTYLAGYLGLATGMLIAALCMLGIWVVNTRSR